MDLFSYGFVSARDMKDELQMRGLAVNIHGSVETDEGEPYEEPVKNRWHILDFQGGKDV